MRGTNVNPGTLYTHPSLALRVALRVPINGVLDMLTPRNALCCLFVKRIYLPPFCYIPSLVASIYHRFFLCTAQPCVRVKIQRALKEKKKKKKKGTH